MKVTQDKVMLKLQGPIQQNIENNLPLRNQKLKELQEQDPKEPLLVEHRMNDHP